MKKILLMAVAALIATVNVSAQEGYDTKHEIGISYGFGSNSDIINGFGGGLGKALGGARSENRMRFGALSAEYFYHVSEVIGVGGILSYARYKEDVYWRSDDTKSGVDTNNYFTIMPSVKFNWLRKDHFGMYSKLAAGVSLCNFKSENENKNSESETENQVKFNWQASLIGIEAGGSRLRGFAELGFGEQGIGLLGIRYKF